MKRFILISLLLMCASMLLYPNVALDAAKDGLLLWANLVFPALFPFFVTAELLIAYRFVEKLGVWIQKPVKVIFRLPGEAGFVLIMGMLCGYPAGARWTADLRRRGLLAKEEAERLLAFSNGPSPLFILGVIAGGYYSSPEIGWVLLGCLYLSTIILGLLLRNNTKNVPVLPSNHSQQVPGPFGAELTRTIRKSVDTLLIVGGVITYFSVLTEMLLRLFTAIGITHTFIPALFEITVGVDLITSLDEPLLVQLCFLTFLTGFHGFSVQAQVVSMLQGTDIRPGTYLRTRILQGIMNVLLLVTVLHMFSIPVQAADNYSLRGQDFPLYTSFILLMYILIVLPLCKRKKL
ncbi:hypothetical protein [Salimicrobium halophilum]|uniref:Sporulation integral membrane protein YlbJ n=1 Tax=Salimicrobium halophilum TaxID=86666 RepID=A0A1G8QH40_9BACI|nr:hypothetical protein [Salimicrobium halophilum]SDJ03883.1 sporulation integral membrane protein YlbJ [Salimicrobium halophilum]